MVWRQQAQAVAGGLFQSPAYLIPQYLGSIALTLEVSRAQLAWVAPLGYGIAVLVGLLSAVGDLVGGRALILWTTVGSLFGCGLITAGGAWAAAGPGAGGVVLAHVGFFGAFAAFRIGALLIPHITPMDPDSQHREGRRLRKGLILGLGMIQLPAGLVGERLGWLWVFGGVTLLLVVAWAVLVKLVPDEAEAKAPTSSPRPTFGEFVRDFRAGFRDRRLVWAAAGGFFAQAAVLAWVAGVPVALARQGYSPGMVGTFFFAVVLAAVFVSRPRSASPTRFGRLAGALPFTGVLVIGAAALTTRHHAEALRARTVGALVFAGALVLGVVLFELSKQWGQTISQHQVALHTDRGNKWRPLAVVSLGANLGTPAGLWLGSLAAAVGGGAGEGALLGLLLVLTGGAWILQASWFIAESRRNR